MGISLGVKIWGDIGPLLTELAKAEKEFKKFSKSTEKIGKDLTMGLTAPIVAFGGLAVKNFGEAEKALTSLKSAIRANGKDVDTVFPKYQKFAEEMHNLTLHEEDANIGFLQLAESMQAPDAEKAVKDAIGLNAAYGIEMPAAVKMATSAQLGLFTQMGRIIPVIRAVKDQTEKANLANKIMGDGFVMATEQTKAGLGPLTQLKNDLTRLSEGFGRIIAESIIPLIQHLRGLGDYINSLSESQKRWIVIIAATAASIGPLFLVISKVAAVLPMVASGVVAFTTAMKFVIPLLAASPWLTLAAAIAAAATAYAAWQLVKNDPSGASVESGSAVIEREKQAVMEYVAANEKGRKKIIADIEAQIKKQEELKTAAGKQLDVSAYNVAKEKIDVLYYNINQMKTAAEDASSAVVTGFGEQGKAIDKAKQELEQYNKMLRAGEAAITYGEFGGSTITRMPSVSKPTGTMTAIPNPTPGMGKIDNSALDNLELMNEALDKVKVNAAGLGGAFSNVFNSIADVVIKAASKVKQSWQEAFAGIASVVSSVVGAISSIMSAGTDRKIQENDNYYQTEKDNIENSYMSQDQKTKALEKLDKGYEKKRKELMREQAKDAKTTAIMQAIINGAVAVTSALTIPIVGEVLAIIVAGLAAAQIAIIASQPLPALAEGGLASAPTMAVVGDNPNARIDPEVISPLSKLKGMLSTAGEMILSARVSGDDLLFITERANKKRSFTRGY